MSVYRFSFKGPRSDEMEDLVGGASFSAAGADLQFDVNLTNDALAEDLKQVLAVAGFAFVAVNPATPPGFATETQIQQLNQAASQILVRLDEIIWHMEFLTENSAPDIGGDGSLLGRLDVVLQLLAFITEAGTPVSEVSSGSC